MVNKAGPEYGVGYNAREEGTMTTIRGALSGARALLRAAQVASADLDAAVLLAHVLGADRATLYTYSERLLMPAQLTAFEALVGRRLQGEPVAYLIGHKASWGLDFLVDHRVLIPRPETELLVKMA